MTKSKGLEPQSLATYWTAPSDAAGAPIVCMASTYTFHARLFEDDLLSRFLGLRYDSQEKEHLFIAEREDKLATVTSAVFVDAAHVDAGQSTGRWSQVPVRVPGGCQHSKITLLVWEKWIRVLVASANLTTTGYRRNREVATCLDFYEGDTAASRQLLASILDFIRNDLLELGSMPPGTKERLNEAITATKQLASKWNLPDASATLPSMTFVPVSPNRPGRKGKGVIDPILNAWGSRSASQIHVMTPFIGDSPDAVRSTLEQLHRIRRARDAKGYLILGGRPNEKDAERFKVDVPVFFRVEWTKAWGIEDDEFSIYGVPPTRDDEPADRILHAKAIMVSSEDRTLLLVGSSNFSPHGLGIGVFNLEANICVVARDRGDVRRLKSALPVDWVADQQRQVDWLTDAPPADEDDPQAGGPPPLPPCFQWATFHEESRTLTLQLGFQDNLPAAWSFWIMGEDEALFDTTRDELILVERRLMRQLTGERARRITHITIRWTDEAGVPHGARLPTLVNDESELLPPDALRHLRSADIVTCLLSGKEPFEWAHEEDPDGGSIKTKVKKGERVPDLLATLDTDAYVMYRARLQGRACSALAQRIRKTPYTQTAIRHRLERDPIGPLMFARAIESEAANASGIGKSATMFALAELLLTLSHIAIIVDPKGSLKLRPIFKNVHDAIDKIAQGFSDTGTASAPLGRYIASVREKCADNAKVGTHVG